MFGHGEQEAACYKHILSILPCTTQGQHTLPLGLKQALPVPLLFLVLMLRRGNLLKPRRTHPHLTILQRPSTLIVVDIDKTARDQVQDMAELLSVADVAAKTGRLHVRHQGSRGLELLIALEAGGENGVVGVGADVGFCRRRVGEYGAVNDQ